MHIIKKGAKNRAVNATLMNSISSRSHALLQVLIERKYIAIDSEIKRVFKHVIKYS